MMNDSSGQDTKLISGLFTRCGLYVSQSENTDPNERSEKLEMKALRKALQRVAEKSTDFTVSNCARMALENINPHQFETRETLTADIIKAVSVFIERGDKFGLLQFQRAIMYIGKSVARAYREELDYHGDEFILETVLKKVTGRLNIESDPEDFKDQNISPAENTALNFILEALRHKHTDMR